MEGAADLDILFQQHIWTLAETVAAWPQMAEVIPGVNNLLIVFDPFI